MKAEIISIGTELLMGEVADTNATYLAGQLPLVGIELLWVTVVGDDMERLAEVMGRALSRSDLVLATGGLGPTDDDLTRDAIAQALGETPEVSSILEQDIRALFDRMGRTMPASNLKQAMLIASAQAIPNPRGTAPGWWVEKGGKVLVSMPGPPSEMQPMWESEVMPRLLQRAKGRVILSRTLKTYGLSEAGAGEMVSAFFAMSNPSLGIYAKPDGIHLRLIARADTREEAQGLIDSVEARMRRVLEGHVWGTDNETLEEVVGKLLTQKGLTLATMESCTGGLLAATLTEVPGSSGYIKGGFVAYSNEAKTALGVDARLIEQHGAVSSETALAMAEAARRQLGADVGIGITGVAGPDKLEGKDPGVVHIAIVDGKTAESATGRYPFGRLQVKRLATTNALFLLKRRLAGQ